MKHCKCNGCTMNDCKCCYNKNIRPYTSLEFIEIIPGSLCKLKCDNCNNILTKDLHSVFTKFINCDYCSLSNPVKLLVSIAKRCVPDLQLYYRPDQLKRYRFDMFSESKGLFIEIMNQHHRYHRFTNDINKFNFIKNNGYRIIYCSKMDSIDPDIKSKLNKAIKSKEPIIFINSDCHSEYNVIKNQLNLPTISDAFTGDFRADLPNKSSEYKSPEYINKTFGRYLNLMGLTVTDYVKKGNGKNCPGNYCKKTGSTQFPLDNTNEFICNTCGYKFYARIMYMYNNLKGCPLCENSHNEKNLYKILKSIDNNVLKEVPLNVKSEEKSMQQRVDFYLPKYNVYIELNDNSHKNDYGISRDTTKFNELKKNNARIIYIWFTAIYQEHFVKTLENIIKNSTKLITKVN